MRKELKKMEEFRGTFTGVFQRTGLKSGYKGPQKTVLLTHIKTIDGKEITDHLWFNYTKGFENLGNITFGEVIQFDARSKPYYKGYKGFRDHVFIDNRNKLDYKLSHPSKIKRY